MSSKQAFVCRPTGTLGTAVTKALLQAGYIIHALVPDLDHERTQVHQAMSPERIKLFQGDILEEALLTEAMSGCIVLFLNIMPSFADRNAEANRGKAIIKAAQIAGIQHIVYVSVLGLDVLTKSEMGAAFSDKNALEEAVQTSEIKHWTLLRPGYFMTNFLPPFNRFYWPRLVEERRAVSSYAPATLLNLTDPRDVAAFALAAFEDSDKFHGEIVSLFSQKLGVEEAIDELRKASGREIETVYRSDAESNTLMVKTPLIAAQLYLRDSGAMRNIEMPERWGIESGSFAGFLAREGDLVKSMFVESE